MNEHVQKLQVCRMCRYIVDHGHHGEMSYKLWVPKVAYRQETKVNAAARLLTFTYCPKCQLHREKHSFGLFT